MRIYWNTLRSFTRRRLGLPPRTPGTPHPDGDAPALRPARRRVLVVAAVLVVGVLIGAVVVLAAGIRHPQRAAPPAATGAPLPDASGRRDAVAGGEPSPEVRTEATRWVVQNVGPGQVVACDAAICGSLVSLNFPAASTVWIKDGLPDLQSADVAVVTETLRSRLGADLTEVTAAEPLAVFGSGAQQLTVQAVAHAGRASYSRSTADDRADRRAAGRALLANSRITFSAPSRDLLRQGLVDMRVCALLATLSSGHTLVVDSFGPAAPGAGPNVPHSTLDLSTVDKVPVVSHTAQATALRVLVAAQHAPYRPLSTTTRTARPGSPAALSLRYSQPAIVSSP